MTNEQKFTPAEKLSAILTDLEPAFRSEGKLHAFRSGGGLRVLRIERDGELIAYSEHPNVGDAFRILLDDYKAGGRDYNEVYGGSEEHYLTGSSAADSLLDQWILSGNTFDAWFSKGRFTFELRGYEHAKTPPDIVARSCAGETIEWTCERGITRVARPSRFPNGERCCSIEVTKRPDGMSHHRATSYYFVMTGVGDTLEQAITEAFSAKKVEVVE